jgi:hypothetical protein
MEGEKMTYPVYLLTIPGTLASPTLEMSRVLHNETAGAPANIAAAQALGDLSHMVYVPTHEDGGLFIMDVWNDLEGLNQFFAHPQVQEQAGRIFSKRDPVVWAPAPADFFCYHLPAPTGQHERILGVVRGIVPSREQARTVNNQAIQASINQARKLGDLSHEVYFRLTPPGEQLSLEFLAVDVWTNREGPEQLYQDPAFLESFGQLFTAPPSTWILQHPAGQWVEW